MMGLGAADLDLFPPGVRLVGGRRRAPIRGVLHDVASFAGIAERGPLDRAVRIASAPEYEEVFGAPVPQGFLAPSVRLFFENGGRAAWIVRVADSAQARAAAVVVLVGEGQDRVALQIEAESPGRWGNRILLRFEPETADRFTLRVASPGRPTEIWTGLSPADLARTGRSPDGLPERRLSIAEAPVGPASLGARAGAASILSLAGRVDASGTTKVVSFDGRRPLETDLCGGTDGLSSLSCADFGLNQGEERGLALLEDIDEVALLAMPDLVWAKNIETRTPTTVPTPCEDYFKAPAAPPRLEAFPDPDAPEPRAPLTSAERARIAQAMVSQARRQGDRFVLLDCAHPSDPRRIFDDGIPGPGEQRFVDGEFAALYYPWLETLVTGRDIALPPSGAMAGLYAKVTLREGPHIAPANLPLSAITGVTYPVSDTEHAMLNGAHVNVIRPVPGRGLRPMGARTRRRDGPFRQVSIRRFVSFLLETLDEETQWLVFEPHDANLRFEVERAVRSFLDRLWRAGALDGARPQDAYSVSVGPETNPPDSIAAGRLICDLAVRLQWPVEWIRLRLVREDGGFQPAGVESGRPPETTRET